MPLEPWREMHPIEGALRKLGWAEKHLDTIEELSKKYQALNPYGMTCDLNPEGTHFDCRLIAKFPPFIDYGREIGEFAYQLRSALDQIVFALSVFPTDLGPRETESAERTPMFRISLAENESLLRSGLKFVPADQAQAVWDVVDRIQPYKAGGTAERHPLALLEEINIRDKHRILNPTTAQLHIDIEGLKPGIEIKRSNASDGDVFARVPKHMDPTVELLPRLTFEELVRVNRPSGGVGITTLRSIHHYVRDAVIPEFAGFFPPLPPTLSL